MKAVGSQFLVTNSLAPFSCIFSGYLHAHISYLDEACQSCLLLLTVDRDMFFTLAECKTKIQEVHAAPCLCITSKVGSPISKVKMKLKSDGILAGRQTQGSTWVKNEVRHGHFKSCRNLTWPVIKMYKVTSWSYKK